MRLSIVLTTIFLVNTVTLVFGQKGNQFSSDSLQFQMDLPKKWEITETENKVIFNKPNAAVSKIEIIRNKVPAKFEKKLTQEIFIKDVIEECLIIYGLTAEEKMINKHRWVISKGTDKKGKEQFLLAALFPLNVYEIDFSMSGLKEKEVFKLMESFKFLD